VIEEVKINHPFPFSVCRKICTIPILWFKISYGMDYTCLLSHFWLVG